jgi:hypothetical protein
MFQLVRALGAMDLAVRQAPVAGVSFILASLFYKFGSFAVEAGAFLATWFVLDALVDGVRLLATRRSAPGQAS